MTNFLAIGNPSSYSISEVGADGSTLLYEQASGGGLFSPGGAALDAAGQFWVANYRGNGQPYGSISEISTRVLNNGLPNLAHPTDT